MSKESPVFEEWPFKVPSIKVAQKKLAAFTEELKNAKSEKEALAVVKKKRGFKESFSVTCRAGAGYPHTFGHELINLLDRGDSSL